VTWVVHLNELEYPIEIYGFVSLSPFTQTGSPCEPDGLPQWVKWVTQFPPLDLPPSPGPMPTSDDWVTHISAPGIHEVQVGSAHWCQLAHLSTEPVEVSDR
jgi:hypothetical protein